MVSSDFEVRFLLRKNKMWNGLEGIYLGIELAIEARVLGCGLSANRREKLLWCIRRALRSNFLPEGEARRLCGKLGWVQTTLMGKCGRAKLIPIRRRGERRGHNRYDCLNHWLRDCLLWWERFLVLQETVLRRTVPLGRGGAWARRPVLIYTDACEFGIGVVACVPSVRGWVMRWAAIPVISRALLDKLVSMSGTELASLRRVLGVGEESLSNAEDLLIAVLEMWAVAVVYRYWWIFVGGLGESPQCARHFIDSNTALAAVVRGSSNGRTIGKVLTALVDNIWLEMAQLKLFSWFGRVSSGDNFADRPSRLEEPVRITRGVLASAPRERVLIGFHAREAVGAVGDCVLQEQQLGK